MVLFSQMTYIAQKIIFFFKESMSKVLTKHMYTTLSNYSYMQIPIWNCVHSGSYPFEIESIRDGVHLALCPFGIVSIRDRVRLEWSPFGIVSIWDCVDSGLYLSVLSFSGLCSSDTIYEWLETRTA